MWLCPGNGVFYGHSYQKGERIHRHGTIHSMNFQFLNHLKVSYTIVCQIGSFFSTSQLEKFASNQQFPYGSKKSWVVDKIDFRISGNQGVSVMPSSPVEGLQCLRGCLAVSAVGGLIFHNIVKHQLYQLYLISLL